MRCIFFYFTIEKGGQKITSLLECYIHFYVIKQPKAASHQLSRSGKREVMNFTGIPRFPVAEFTFQIPDP